jgi:hypothetical protein
MPADITVSLPRLKPGPKAGYVRVDLRALRMTAVQSSYTVRFLCPAFFGNAEQCGQWRTPPFKALLRQWWRVAYAADHRFPADVATMHAAEARLFGAAADAGHSNRSRVRVRLDRWDPGRLTQWEPAEGVWHPEVELRRQGRVIRRGSRSRERPIPRVPPINSEGDRG